MPPIKSQNTKKFKSINGQQSQHFVFAERRQKKNKNPNLTITKKRENAEGGRSVAEQPIQSHAYG